MKNRVIESLELVYYNYDKTNGAFTPCKDSTNSSAIYNELIKITHELSKKNIKYIVDNSQNIYLDSSSTIYSKLKMSFNSLVQNIKNSNQNIFILSDKKVKWAKNLPMIEIVPIQTPLDFSYYEAIIFTSKNAILSLNSFNTNWVQKPLYVIAPQTAKTASNLGGKVRFVGKTKHGDEFAYELIEQLKGKKVLYIRGERSVSNIADILNENGVECDEAKVYKTDCKSQENKPTFPKNSIIIFSSPSTIECFLKNTEWDDSFIAISIGRTTLKHFPEYIDPIVADTTSLESCVELALEIKNKKG
ncbi:MAG: uroporphyrinogen-III synthase [Sulfurimonas sp.]|jgi:uroporphyrinogen-III synthase|nr:uroporphyrinogen-III synthase [Sulfurimonadaceae bacterium]